MKKDRVNMLIDVEFEYEGHKEKESVWVPYPIYVEAIRKTFEDGLVSIDGTDNAIWNMFVELDMVDNFEDNDTFVKHCLNLYKGSKYEEEDYESWLEDYKELHQGE